jgi:hypothetical protein
LVRLGERLAATERCPALAFAAEATDHARALDLSNRAQTLALAGALLARLGREASGRTLIEEAAVTAAQIPPDAKSDATRAIVAGELARFDLIRAEALIAPIRESLVRHRGLALLAHAIAAADPSRAVALADEVKADSNVALLIRTDIAYQIGSLTASIDKTEEALAVLDNMTGRGSVRARAEAFGWLAVSVTPRTPRRGVALIDRALDLPLRNPEEFVDQGSPMLSAAWIAACARRVGNLDMPSIVARVLATRGTGPRQAPAQRIHSETLAAAALALTDPASARHVLRAIESRSHVDASTLGRLAGEHWLTAWALVDLDHAESLVEAEFTALEGRRDVDLGQTGLLRMATALAVPADRREEFLRNVIGGNWYPGFPY